MRRIFLALLLVASAAAAQESQGFLINENCSTTGNQAAVGEVCMFINGTTTHMQRLQLAFSMLDAWTGAVTCTDAHVNIGCTDGVDTCTTAGQEIADFGRKHWAMCEVVIHLRREVKRREKGEDVQQVPNPTEPDIGGGDTG